MLGHRKPVPPDPSLLARVGDGADVALGTYPEAVVALVCASPAPDPVGKDRSRSAFWQLDDQDREGVMRAALGELVTGVILDRSARSDIGKIRADGLSGKLALDGPLANLYELSYWFRRSKRRITIDVRVVGSDRLREEQLPDGSCLPVIETCFRVAQSENDLIFLVERLDQLASTLTYSLRTARSQFRRVADFLFADITTRGEHVEAILSMSFEYSRISSLLGIHKYRREHGEDEAAYELNGFTPGIAGVQQGKPESGRIGHDRMVAAMTAYLYRGTRGPG